MSFYQAASELLAQSRSCIPLQPGSKTPFYRLLFSSEDGRVSWGRYSQRKPTHQEIEDWSRGSNDAANIGMPMGAISGNLGLDVDFRKGGEKTWRELTKGQFIVTETVGSGDGFHFLWNYPGFKVRLKEALPGIDLRSDGSYLVRPPSVHPSGKVYTQTSNAPPSPIPPWLADLLEPCPVLQQGVLPFVDESLDVHVCHSAFTHCWNTRKYLTLSEFDFGVIVTLVNRGCDFETLRQAFQLESQPTHFGRVMREQGFDSASRYLAFSYNKALAQTGSLIHSEFPQRAAYLRFVLSQRLWLGPTARTDQTVLLAHVTRFERARSWCWNLDVRTGEQISRIGRTAFARSTHRLIAEGWLDSDTEKRVTLFSFGAQAMSLLQQKSPQAPLASTLTMPGQTLTGGVFENVVGLGRAAERVWLALSSRSQTQVELVLTTGLNKGTISRKVSVLERYGIIFRDGRYYKAIPDFNFQHLGSELGTISCSALRVQTHNIERTQYHADSERK